MLRRSIIVDSVDTIDILEISRFARVTRKDAAYGPGYAHDQQQKLLLLVLAWLASVPHGRA